jgi:hypothetical protein
MQDTKRRGAIMKVKTRGKIGVSGVNHNETRVRVQKPTPGLKVKTNIKAGRAQSNREELTDELA